MTRPSWRTRLERADHHLQEVEREVEKFLAAKPYRTAAEMVPHPLVPQMCNYKLRAFIDAQPPPVLAEMVGEVAEGLRSALDRIVNQLARQGGEDGTRSEFPIFVSSEEYRTGHRRKTAGLAEDARAVIERSQPYHRLDPPDDIIGGPQPLPDHPLYLIHELRRIHTHRHPHLTGAVVENSSFGIKEMNGVDLKIRGGPGQDLRAGAFQDGTVIFTMQLTVTHPNPVFDLDFQLDFDVVFDPEGPAGVLPS